LSGAFITVRFVEGKEELEEERRKDEGIWWEILSGGAIV
jgi:hypothetical protein